jgi:hypothetical protein
MISLGFVYNCFIRAKIISAEGQVKTNRCNPEPSGPPSPEFQGRTPEF